METKGKSKADRSFRNYFIAPREQIAHAGFLFISIVVGLSTVCFALLFQVQNLSDELTLCNGAELSIIRLKNAILMIFIWGVFGIGVFYSILSFVLTHRVFGSLFAVERYLQALLDGKNPEPIYARKDSQVQKVISLVNQVGEELKKKKSN